MTQIVTSQQAESAFRARALRDFATEAISLRAFPDGSGGYEGHADTTWRGAAAAVGHGKTKDEAMFTALRNLFRAMERAMKPAQPSRKDWADRAADIYCHQKPLPDDPESPYCAADYLLRAIQVAAPTGQGVTDAVLAPLREHLVRWFENTDEFTDASIAAAVRDLLWRLGKDVTA